MAVRRSLLYASGGFAVGALLLLLRRRRRLAGFPFRVRWLLYNQARETHPIEPSRSWLSVRQAQKVRAGTTGYAFTWFERVYSNLTGWQPAFVSGTRGADLELTVGGGNLALPARAFVKEDADGAPAAEENQAKALVLMIHGGGWVFLGSGTHDIVARQLAHESGAAVVAVDYRMAPLHPYPTPLDDCIEALRYVASDQGVKQLERALMCRIDSKKIFVCGDSAGGNLAAALCAKLRALGDRALLPKVVGQILVYPCLSRKLLTTSDEESSYARFASGYGLTKEDMKWYWRMYTNMDVGETCDTPAAIEKVRFAAIADTLQKKDLVGLPPAVIILASHDVLHDDGVLYHKQLVEAGVDAEVLVVPETIHGLWEKRGLDRTGQKMMCYAASTFIKTRLKALKPVPPRLLRISAA